MTYSISLFHYDPEGMITAQLAADYTAGTYVSGKLKVLHAFFAELMTHRGSVRFDPYYGCDLLKFIGVSSVRSLQDVESLVTLSAATVVSNMQARYRGDEPNDEKITAAALIDCRQYLDSAEAHLRLEVASGESAILQLPISFLPPK
jgi:hypothetical protein